MKRPSTTFIVAVAFGVSQCLLAWSVAGQADRMGELTDAQRLESIADCVEVREQARQNRRENTGIRALATEDVAVREALLRELREPIPPAEVLFQQDVAVCERHAEPSNQLDKEPSP